MKTEELVKRCIRKDKLAWDEFVCKYQGLVKRAVYYKLNKMNSKSLRSEVDDIVQEVFLMLWRDNKLTQLKDLSSLKGWLAIVTINKTLNYCKRRWKEQQRTRSLNQSLGDDGFTLEDIIPSGAFDPNKALAVKEMVEGIRHGVKMLKKKEKRALELNLYGGKRQTDIAEVMDIPVGTVSTLISRAKRKVQESVREYQLS